ncbi:MAG: hypothetical protein C5B49_05790 [Bdellovibrio sp.]|nr:MAG: hypothetical protein C5B49_05790 [Bdellovibrio sp.]
MNKRSFFTAMTMMMGTGAVFVPATVFADALSLGEAIKIGRESSPDIKQLEAQYLSAVQKTNFALAPGEPTISIMHNDLSTALNIGTAASTQIQLTQPIGFPGRAVLNRAQLTDQANAIQYQLSALNLQVSVNIKTAYYNLQLAQRNIQLNADTRLAYERILEVTRRRYESGATGQVDFLNAQVSLLSNENDLADLQTAEKIARAQLNVMLKRPSDAAVEVEPIKMVDLPEINPREAIDKMVENRNEIKAAQAQQKAADKSYQLAWMGLLPDFQLILGTTQYHESYASPYSGVPALAGNWPTTTYMVGVQFTVPIWFMFNERASIRGASFDRASADHNVDVVLNQSKMALENAVDAIHSTAIKIQNFEKHILPLSDQSFKLALIDYSSGRINFQTLSDTAAARRQARLNYATAVVAYLTNYATYGQLIGEDFQ